jgi:hypothetical protein
MRNALAYVPKTQETVVAAAIRQAFIQPDREMAGQVWRHVADQLRPRFEKLGRLMDEAEHDVLAYMTFAALRTHLRDFVDAYNFARRLKTLGGLTPYEFICKAWTSERHRFKISPLQQMPGLNTWRRPLSSTKGPAQRLAFGLTRRGLTSIAGSASSQARISLASTRVRRPHLTARNSPELIF